MLRKLGKKMHFIVQNSSIDGQLIGLNFSDGVIGCAINCYTGILN